MGQIKHIIDVLSGVAAQMGSPSVGMIGAFMVEGVAKLWPTSNPQGWLIWSDKLLKKLGDALAQVALAVKQVGDLLVKLDSVVVAVIPQNIAK
jgi:hypothetical protein